MATKKAVKVVKAVMLDDEPLSLLDICKAVNSPAETVVEMVEYGIVEPTKGRTPANWQFSVYALKRTRTAVRLQNDLRINLEGLGLAMDLLEEVKSLRRRVEFFERHFN